MDQVSNYSYIEYPIQKVVIPIEGIANPEIKYSVSEIPDSPIDVHRFNEQYVFYHDSTKPVTLKKFAYFRRIPLVELYQYRVNHMGSGYVDTTNKIGYRYFYQLNTSKNTCLVSGMDRKYLWLAHFNRSCKMNIEDVQNCPDHIRLQEKLLSNRKDGFTLDPRDPEFYINVDNLVLRESVYIEW